MLEPLAPECPVCGAPQELVLALKEELEDVYVPTCFCPADLVGAIEAISQKGEKSYEEVDPEIKMHPQAYAS